MKEKKRDLNIVNEAVGDPSFYNDNITKDKEPSKTLYKEKKGGKSRK